MRFFTIGPASKPLHEMNKEERKAAWTSSQERFQVFGAEHEWTGTRSPGMHKTETIDYIIVLQGEVTLVLDESETELKPMDVVIQRGTNHGWVVDPGKPPCTMVAVLIDTEVQGGKSVGEYRQEKGQELYVESKIPSNL